MKKITIITLLGFLALGARAQDYSWRLNYEVSIPTGDMADTYIKEVSWRGISIDNRWNLSPQFSVGFNIGWNAFSERKDNVLYTNNEGTISAYGNQFRFINTFPVQANAHYYFGNDVTINPWAGLGVGTAISKARTELGFLAYEESTWDFAITPQIGVDVPIGTTTFFTLGAKYNYFMHEKVNFDYSFITINAGFRFIYF